MSLRAADANWEDPIWLLNQFVVACDDVTALNGLPEDMIGTHRKPVINMNLLAAAARVVRMHQQ